MDISHIVDVLERMWVHIRERCPEVPPVAMIVASGSDGKRWSYGHFATSRWVINGEERSEVMISGEGMRAGAKEVLVTLLHEAAHGLATARKLKDCSREGRYHNKTFKRLAEELGLAQTHDKTIGWSVSALAEGTADQYGVMLAELSALIGGEAGTVYRHRDLPPVAQKDRSNGSRNGIRVYCGCGRSLRITESVLAQGPIVCGCCDEEFAPREDGE